jgi:hypothetical protein
MALKAPGLFCSWLSTKPEGGLPAPGVTGGVPQLAARGLDDMDLVAQPGATDGAEDARVVLLLSLDQAEDGLPAAVTVTDGVPRQTRAFERDDDMRDSCLLQLQPSANCNPADLTTITRHANPESGLSATQDSAHSSPCHRQVVEHPYLVQLRSLLALYFTKKLC